MKKRMIWCAILTLLFGMLTACGGNLQGVSYAESGEVMVTFRLPEGKGLRKTLGSELGEERQLRIAQPGDNPGDSRVSIVKWREVDNGGIVCSYGDLYCYSPEAEPSSMPGTIEFVAPTWMTWPLVFGNVTEDEILRPEDADLLQERYGIQLDLE